MLHNTRQITAMPGIDIFIPASDRVSRARPYSGFATVGRQVSRTGLSPAAAGPSMPFRYLTPL